MIEHALPTFHAPAFKLSLKIINHLLDNWGPYGNDLLYSINVPMVQKLLDDDEMKVYWTSVWRSNSGRLFKEVPGPANNNAPGRAELTTVQTTDVTVPVEGGGDPQFITEEEKLVFAFKPDLSAVLSPTAAPEGTDSWALNVDAISVTPCLARFAEPPESEYSFSSLQEREWKFKL